jgi:hypothetical protein
VQAISKLLHSRAVSLSILLELTDQCVIGFLPGASVIPFMSEMVDEFVQLIQSCDPAHFVALSDPISSPRRAVVRFYTLLWALAIGGLLDRPPALAALARHSLCLLHLVEQPQDPLGNAAKYILDCLKVSAPAVTAQLRAVGESLSKVIAQDLKSVKPKPVQPPAEETVAPSKVAAPPPTPSPAAPDLATLTSAAEVLLLGKGKKKPQSCTARLMPDARILTWVAAAEISGEEAIDLLDVKKVSTPGQGMLRVDAKSGLSVQLQFHDQKIAEAWQTVIQETIKLAH